MKYISLLLVLLLLPTALAAEGSASVVDATLLSYQPVPAKPGDTIEVNIQLDNGGSNAARNLEVEILEGAVFTPEGVALRTVGELPAYNSFLTSFKVRVARDAAPGERVLNLRHRQAGNDWQEDSVNITVTTDDAAVFVTDVELLPSIIEPGKEADLSLTVENLAATRLRDVSVDIDLDNSPFIPVQGTTRKKVNVLGPLQATVFEYTLAAKPSATADTYRIPVVVSFLDELGNTKNQSDTIGIRVNTQALTRAFVDDVSRSNGDSTVTVRVVNKGLSEIKFVEAAIGSGNGYTIASQDREHYLGNIDSDDWETIRFDVATDASEIEVPISYTYQDAFNEQRTVEQRFTIDIPEAASNGAGGATTFVIVLVVAVVGIVWWRRRKKKR